MVPARWSKSFSLDTANVALSTGDDDDDGESIASSQGRMISLPDSEWGIIKRSLKFIGRSLNRI